MTEIVVFHHAQGLTEGVLAFGDELRGAGHRVHTPDLYEGRTFDELGAGVAHAQQVGFGTILERARRAVEGLPGGALYTGMSLGVMPAEHLALTRPGALGAVLLYGFISPLELGLPWLERLPAQVHLSEGDEWVLPPNEDLEAARLLAASVESAELFVYPGDAHLVRRRRGARVRPHLCSVADRTRARIPRAPRVTRAMAGWAVAGSAPATDRGAYPISTSLLVNSPFLTALAAFLPCG